jgi:hypothetical protein
MSGAVSLRRPKYRLHKAKGLAVVTLDGRDHYLGAAASHEKYRRLMAEWALVGGHLPVMPTAIIVSEILVAYRRFARGC